MEEKFCERLEDEPNYNEINEFIDLMSQKHMNCSILYKRSSEMHFINFLYAYINQDIEDIQEAIDDFKSHSSNEVKQDLIDGINEFINLPYSEKEKAYYVEEATGGYIRACNWLEQFEYIKSELMKK